MTVGQRIARLTGDERWNRYTPEILSHIVQGAFCGAGMGLPLLALATGAGEDSPLLTVFVLSAFVAFVTGALWMCWSFCYQLAGFLRKHDTIARDWRDYLAGWPLGFAPVAVAAAVSWL